MMRILCFLHLTKLNGSSRLLCIQYKEFFKAQGVDIYFVPTCFVWEQKFIFEKSRHTQSRMLRGILSRIFYYGIVLPRRIVTLFMVPYFDVTWIERALLSQHTTPWLERIVQKIGRAIVYSFDDALYAKDDPDLLIQRIKMADAVFTGSPTNLDFARKFNQHVHEISGAVDVLYYYRAKEHYGIHNRKAVIGWIGSAGNDEEIAVLRSVFRRISKKYNVCFRIVGAYQIYYPDDDIAFEFKKWSLNTEVESIQQFDIGIMPLRDNAYNRGREGYKIKQYMACGVPVICSPVGMNTSLVTHKKTGLWAATEEEWEKQLSTLLTNEDLREKLGKAGRRLVEERFSIEEQGRLMLSVFSQMLTSKRKR